MPIMTARLRDLYRYPVRPLSADPLTEAMLVPDGGLPHDRRFAIASGALGHSLDERGLWPRAHTLGLARFPRLAALESRFDAESGVLTIHRKGRQVARGQITTPTGRILLQQFLAAYLGRELPGVPHIVEAPAGEGGIRLMSLLSLASVEDLESRIVKAPVAPQRFRANLLIEGLAPWAEMRWSGRRLRVGEAVLEVAGPIERDESINVEPGTGNADLNLRQALERGCGHSCCGVHVRVVEGGRIAAGDLVELV